MGLQVPDGNGGMPLSRRRMPKTLDDFIGQSHLVAQGKPIRTMLTNNIIHSMIFYGPPASGKTSLAEIIAEMLQCEFITSSALTIDSDQIREHLKTAEKNLQSGKRTVLFIDEIHRLIKPKQDAFLSAMEHGMIHIIGATTENPYFIIQPALRSRLFIYEFKPLTRTDLETILDNAIAKDQAMRDLGIEFAGDAKRTLIDLTLDPRVMLDTLEMIALAKSGESAMQITVEDIEELLQKADTKYNQGDAHYDVISAFVKSVRGSDPDAAIYYLAMMLEGGEDPLFIARRLIILAAEDIGLAYPEALPVAVACYQAIERIGMPEGQLVLAETTGLLAGAPKSNTTTMAIGKARSDIQNGNVMQIPPYLRDSHYKGATDLGRGIGYKYPHAFPDHYIEQAYTEKPVKYFEANDLGFEKRIRDWLERIRAKKRGG